MSLTPEQLDGHLRLLRRRGYESGDRATLAELASGARLDRPYAFPTFDDGYRDILTEALPILRDHGFTAHIFVLPSRVDLGGPLDWPEVEDARRQYPEVMRSLDWGQVEELAEAGMEIGSHTLSHGHLPQLGDEELRQELLDSRKQIAARLGRCDTLAYPFAEWNSRVKAAAKDAGYRFAFTAPYRAQKTWDPLTIPRLLLDHRDEPWRLALKLTRPGRSLLLSPLRRRLPGPVARARARGR